MEPRVRRCLLSTDAGGDRTGDLVEERQDDPPAPRPSFTPAPRPSLTPFPTPTPLPTAFLSLAPLSSLSPFSVLATLAPFPSLTFLPTFMALPALTTLPPSFLALALSLTALRFNTASELTEPLCLGPKGDALVEEMERGEVGSGLSSSGLV